MTKSFPEMVAEARLRIGGVTAEEAAADANAVILDVREDKELAAAKIEGDFVHIPLGEVAAKAASDPTLAAAKGVRIGIAMQRKIMTGLFGGEGFILQKLEGDGMAFIHAGGTVRQFMLKPGRSFHVDTGCLVAMEHTVQYDIVKSGSLRTMAFGGEGLFLAQLTGPGRVWLQSLPFARFSERVLENAAGSSRVGEAGSLLGGLGDLMNGDG